MSLAYMYVRSTLRGETSAKNFLFEYCLIIRASIRTFSALCIPAILSLICLFGVAVFSSGYTIFSQYLGQLLSLFPTKSKF